MAPKDEPQVPHTLLTLLSESIIVPEQPQARWPEISIGMTALEEALPQI